MGACSGAGLLARLGLSALAGRAVLVGGRAALPGCEALRRRRTLRGARAGRGLRAAALYRREPLRGGGACGTLLRAGALLLPLGGAGRAPGCGHSGGGLAGAGGAGVLRPGTLWGTVLLLGAPRREDAAPVEGALSLQTGLVGDSARLGEDVAVLAYQLVVDRRIR